MSNDTPQLICSYCGASAAPLDWKCALCGGPIDIANLPAFQESAIRAEDWSLWRYGTMLPVEKRFSLGEGATPMITVDYPGGVFRAKLEYLNPTGSYKDRGTVTLVNYLLAQGVTEVVEDSSGNAGASLAAYARSSGIHARVFVSAQAAPGKKRQISYGAELVEVVGPRAAASDACEEAARKTVYASHAWSPFFAAGQMTAAWEVWEQMGRRVPDAVATPTGHGGLLLGFARGFKALRSAGLIDRLPRLYAIQSEACDPLVVAWEHGLADPAQVSPRETAADGIIVGVPVRGREILAALRETNGGAFRVGDVDVRAAREQLAQRGLLVEPTSAVPVAALKQIRAHLGRADADILIPLTGSGLKGLTG